MSLPNLQDHVDKFHELTNHTYSFNFLNPYEEGKK